MTKTVLLMTPLLLIPLLFGCLLPHAADAEEIAVYPVESCGIGPDGGSNRLAIRFDLSQLQKTRSMTRATLYLTGKLPSEAIEVRPILTQWGGMHPAVLKREAEPIWTEAELKQPGSKISQGYWQFGDPNWNWAVRGIKKWKTSGGDLAPAVATLESSRQALGVDITKLVASWRAKPKSNYGIMLTAGKGEPFRRCAVRLVLEGKGVDIVEKLAMEERPSWIPASYQVKHPRLPYPSKVWLAALQADQTRMQDLNRRADNFNPEKSGWHRDIGNLVLAQKFAPTPKRAELISQAIDANYPNASGYTKCYALSILYDWGYDLLSSEERRRLAYRLERMCTHEEDGSAWTLISPYNDVGTSRFGCGLLWGWRSTQTCLLPTSISGVRRHTTSIPASRFGIRSWVITAATGTRCLRITSMSASAQPCRECFLRGQARPAKTSTRSIPGWRTISILVSIRPGLTSHASASAT